MPMVKASTYPENYKINIDGAYLIDFDSRIDYKDRQSGYAAHYAWLKGDRSLIYIAECLDSKWFFGLWNPPLTNKCKSLGECRLEIRTDFQRRIKLEGIEIKSIKDALYFANMQWSTNYEYSRQVAFRDDCYERYGSTTEIDLLDYAVYFVFSEVHKYKKILYVVERISKNWFWHRWTGSDVSVGSNHKACKIALWKHMDNWCRTQDYSERLSRYRSFREA